MTETAGACAADSRLSGRAVALLLLVVSVLIYAGTAAHPALLDDADSAHAIVSREMLQRGDWTILYMNGIRYLMKAPLHYWAVALSYKLLGQSAFSTRLPVALAMVGLTLLVYAFARRFFGLRAGLYSGLAASTGIGFYIFTRIMIPEAIYALEFTGIFYLFLRGWTGTLSPRVAYGGVAAVTALAMLTRGLVGVIFPVAILGLFITATRGWHRWRELRLIWSSAIFLAIAAPWHILASLRANTFFYSYFINEHFKRAVGTRYPPDYEAVPLVLWYAAHLAWLFPWSFFLPGILRRIPGPRRWRELDATGQARLLVALWAGFILLFFSLTFGSRMEYYSFGAWPALAILLGTGLAQAEQEARRWVKIMQGALAAVGLVLASVLSYLLWISWKVSVNGDISSLLQAHENNFYRLSMAHFLDLTPQAFAALRCPAAMAAAAFLFGLGAAGLLRWRGKAIAATMATAATMILFLLAANLAYAVFEPYLSSRPLVQAIAPYLRPGDPIVLYGELSGGSSVAFYAHRRLLLYNGLYNNIVPGSRYPDAPPIFLTDADFPALWHSPQRVFLFVPENQRDEALKRLPSEGSFLIAESGGKRVYANQDLSRR